MVYRRIFSILLFISMSFSIHAKNIDYYSICLDLSGNINNGVVEQCSDYAITKYKSEMTIILNKVKKNDTNKYNTLKNQQNKWLKDAGKSCEKSDVHYTFCMLGEYDDRLTTLKKQFKN
jgi:hypothetical protein